MRKHDFNTAWWGSPVGVSSMDDYFALDDEARKRALDEFAWIEVRGRANAQQVWLLVRDGFARADTQIHFRVGLDPRRMSSSSAQLLVENAVDAPASFDFSSMASFAEERFLLLPGVDETRLQRRFSGWAANLVKTNPSLCLAVRDPSGHLQGWFLSHMETRGLNLTLAMMSKDATISGFHIYERVLAYHAEAGHRVGFASFSVDNVSVLNIYARLTASFVRTESIWLRAPRELRAGA